MNILLASSMYLPHLGGVELAVHHLAKQLQKRGQQVAVLAARFPRQLKAYEIMDGVPTFRTYFPFPGKSVQATLAAPLVGPLALYRLWRLIQARGVEIMHLHFLDYAALYLSACRRLSGTPLIVTLHGSDAQKLRTGSRTGRAIFRYVVQQTDRVTTNSASLLAVVEAAVPGISAKAAVIPNGIELDKFASAKAYNAGKPYILALGRLDYTKGFDILLEAFAQAVRQEPELFLLIAGDGPERPQLEQMIRTLRLASHTSLVGRVQPAEAASLFKGCEFFVLPSRAEAFGIVNLEAMAAGKAILAFAVGGVPEVIQSGVNGVLVPAGDQEALAEGILALWRDAPLRLRLGAAGKKIVCHYTWDKIADRYLEVYHESCS